MIRRSHIIMIQSQVAVAAAEACLSAAEAHANLAEALDGYTDSDEVKRCRQRAAKSEKAARTAMAYAGIASRYLREASKLFEVETKARDQEANDATITAQ